MSIRERAGQVVVAAYSGSTPPAQLVRQQHLGGVIVLEPNVGDVSTLGSRLRGLQQSSGREFPLWIGVDQEGGVVQRLGAPFTQFGPYMAQGAARNNRLSAQVALVTAQELHASGFTSVFAPVADVTTGPSDPTIGSRSAGDQPGLVSRTNNASLQGYARGGVLSVLKHFPGHGSVPADSHEELPVQDASVRQLRSRDLVPFARAAKSGVPAIMAAHISVQAVDPGVPSSLSRPVITGLLRRELGYDGVVVTDALNMAGVTADYGTRSAAVRALRAGNDVLLMPPEPAEAVDAVADAVRSGALSGDRLREAATRMVALLLQQRVMGGGAAEPAAVAVRQAQGAVTSVSGPCRGRLVGSAVRATGDPTAVAAFSRAASAAGLPVDAGGDTVALQGYGAGPTSADVVVATDTPYLLAGSNAPVRLATFGNGPAAMRALVDVLLGKARAPGRLPVAVPGLSRIGC
jgi:beta-N-acetylhexosaminidase